MLRVRSRVVADEEIVGEKEVEKSADANAALVIEDMILVQGRKLHCSSSFPEEKGEVEEEAASLENVDQLIYKARKDEAVLTMISK